MNDPQPEHEAPPAAAKAANDRPRFSLATLMAAVTLLAVVLAVARLMGPRLVAEVLFVVVGWAVILAPLLVFGTLRLLHIRRSKGAATTCLAALAGLSLLATLVVVAVDGWHDALSVLCGLSCVATIWLFQCALIWFLRGLAQPTHPALQRRRALPQRVPPFSMEEQSDSTPGHISNPR